MKLDKLKALAEKATPGPWIASPNGKDGAYVLMEIGTAETLRMDFIADVNYARDGGYIAACSPDYILKLIACVEAASVMHGKVSKSWGHSYPDCDCVLCSFEARRAAMGAK